MKIGFDKYSLEIDNEKKLIKSASLHYFRSPGEKIWRDRLSKLKACGYDAVDLYFCWGYHSDEPGKYDFSGAKDIRKLLDITAELGLFVIARPGPYINAELSAGGLPFWLLSKKDAKLRNRCENEFCYSEPYMEPVREWYSTVIPIINEYKNVITVQIENEYSTDEVEPDYMQELYDLTRKLGVKVPLFHNDAFSACLYADIVDIYAFDTYPSINFEYDWRDFPENFGGLDQIENNLKGCSEDAPLYIAELQGGWFDKWNGVGYKKIIDILGKEHINIVTKTALSQGVTMFNHYMGCGGTSWDRLPCAEVYACYDFSAPISENGIPKESYYKSKELNSFLDSYNLCSTDLKAESEDILTESYTNIYARLRKDNTNNCDWLFIRNLNKETNQVEVKVDDNSFKLSINPLDMKILPAGLDCLGCKLDFSSISIYKKLQKGNYETIFLILEDNANLSISNYDDAVISDNFDQFKDKNVLNINLKPGYDKEIFSNRFIKDGKVTELIFITEDTANKTWFSQDKILIGADLVLNNNTALFEKETELNILYLNNYDIIKSLNIKENNLKNNFITKQIENDEKIIELNINEFNSLPCAEEIDSDYDYTDWKVVENNVTDCLSNNIYDRFLWYKGEFTGCIDKIEINAKHTFAVYINEELVYRHDAFYYDHGMELNETITFEVNKKYLKKKNNQITVLAENMGFDKGFQNDLKSSRGILEFKTYPQKDIKWHIRGGLTPELKQWNLITEKNIETSCKNNHLGWLSTEFDIDVFKNTNSPLSLELVDMPFDKAWLYLNGKLIGSYWKKKGLQRSFYLIDEFLEQKNRLTIIVWNKNPENQHSHDFKNFKMYVNIKIRNLKKYKYLEITNC